jgi:type II secretory pathway component PulM
MIALVRDRMAALSASERVLIAIALALGVVLVGTTLALGPLRIAHAEARLDYEDAARLLDEVRTGVALAATRRGDASSAGDARGVVTGTAMSRGLAISRMSPVDRGGLSVRLERADPTVLYAWLATLESEHAITVRRATVRRAGEGAGEGSRVEAEIVLSGGGAS